MKAIRYTKLKNTKKFIYDFSVVLPTNDLQDIIISKSVAQLWDFIKLKFKISIKKIGRNLGTSSIIIF